MSKATIYHAKPISSSRNGTYDLDIVTNYEASLGLLSIYPSLQDRAITIYSARTNGVQGCELAFYFDRDHFPELAEHELSCTAELDIHGDWYYYCDILKPQ